MSTVPRPSPVKSPLPEWRAENVPVPYPVAVEAMETRVERIFRGEAAEQVWLLEHPPVYTAGTSARDGDLIDARFPVFRTGRGGQFTYHGPGQRVGYVMLDLKTRGNDVRNYVRDLEEWLVLTLRRFDLKGERRAGRVGIWITRGDSEMKIGAIGVRLRRWVTYHGVSLNIDPDLSHFSGIVPCGIREYGVTSLAELGVAASMDDADRALKTSFEDIFGPVG